MRLAGAEHQISLHVNQRHYTVRVRSSDTLLDVLREKLGLMGTKKGCDTGECGGCTVLLNDKAVNSCLVLAVDARDKQILTIEGLASADGKPDPVQDAFVQQGAIQCGYCSPGMIMTVKALLHEKPHPTEADIRFAIAGNLCRCGTYPKVVEAVKTLSPQP
jgi:carbon-monoxide dehydrogenase small subunit